MIVSAIYNQSRSKKSDKFFQPSDFFKFRAGKQQTKASPEEIEASQTGVLSAMYVATKTKQKRKRAQAQKGNG